MTDEQERLYEDVFITIKEAQERLQVSRSFLTRATKAGELPRYRVGYGRGRVVLAIEDVDALGQPRRDDRGFTLIELLVVVILIGILAAIAIPVFMNQKAKAVDAALRAELKGAATAVEAYWDTGSWADLRTTTGVTATVGAITLASPYTEQWSAVPGTSPIKVSTGTTLTLTGVTGPYGSWTRPAHAAGEFCITGLSKRSRTYAYVTGSGAAHYDELLYWDSAAGGVRAIRELAALQQTGIVLACQGYVSGWLAAGGAL